MKTEETPIDLGLVARLEKSLASAVALSFSQMKLNNELVMELMKANTFTPEQPAPARIAEPIAQPAPPAESTSNVIERAISLMDKDSPEEAYELLKKHAACSPAEKSLSDGAKRAPDDIFGNKRNGRPNQADAVLANLTATLKPADTLAADGEADREMFACRDRRSYVSDSSKIAYVQGWRDCKQCAGVAHLQSRLKEAEAKLAEYEKDIEGILEECAKEIALSNDFPWAEEVHCAFRALRADKEQAVAKERASIAELFSYELSSLPWIAGYLRDNLLVMQATKLEQLHARLTQPSNLSGEAKAL